MKTLIKKIKLVWKGRKVAGDLINIKSRWKEPTFWASLLGNAATAFASAQGMIPAEYAKVAIWVNSILSVAYTNVRSYQKSQAEGIKPYKTASEFLMGMLTIANSIFLNAQAGGIDAEWMAPAILMTGGSLVGGRDAANMEPKEAQAKVEGTEVKAS